MQVHHGAVAVVELAADGEGVVVAVDVDPLAGEHLRVQGDALRVGQCAPRIREVRVGANGDVEAAERDVVTDPQQDPAGERVDRRRVDGRVRNEDVALRVLDEQDRVLVLGREDRVGRVDQVQVVALARVLADGQADVACERLRDQNIQRAFGLGEVDVVRRLGAEPPHDHVRRVLRVTVTGVDLEVVPKCIFGAGPRRCPGADVAAVRRGRNGGAVGAEVDVVRLDVRDVELAVEAETAAARVDKRAVRGHERRVAVREDPVDRHVAGRLGDEDAVGAARRARIGDRHRVDVPRRASGGGVGHVEHAESSAVGVHDDLEEIARDADAAVAGDACKPILDVVAGDHRDVARDHVGRRVVVGVEDRPRCTERHVAVRRLDLGDAQVAEVRAAGARLLGVDDEAVRVHVDVARVLADVDVGDDVDHGRGLRRVRCVDGDVALRPGLAGVEQQEVVGALHRMVVHVAR